MITSIAYSGTNQQKHGADQYGQSHAIYQRCLWGDILQRQYQSRVIAEWRWIHPYEPVQSVEMQTRWTVTAGSWYWYQII